MVLYLVYFNYLNAGPKCQANGDVIRLFFPEHSTNNYVIQFWRENSQILTILKGGDLDYSHLTKLKKKYIYITEICMKKQYKSSIIKNRKITKKKKKMMVFP